MFQNECWKCSDTDAFPETNIRKSLQIFHQFTPPFPMKVPLFLGIRTTFT